MSKMTFLHFVVIFLLFQGCTLFPDVEKIVIYECPYHEKMIRIYYISANATSQNMMQICLVTDGGNERVVANYECYNHVISVDTSIDYMKIVASDTSAYFPHSPDTLYISKELLK